MPSYYQQFIIDTIAIVPADPDDTIFTSLMTTAMDKQYDWIYDIKSPMLAEDIIFQSFALSTLEEWEYFAKQACFSLFQNGNKLNDMLALVPSFISTWYNDKF